MWITAEMSAVSQPPFFLSFPADSMRTSSNIAFLCCLKTSCADVVPILHERLDHPGREQETRLEKERLSYQLRHARVIRNRIAASIACRPSGQVFRNARHIARLSFV